MACFFFVTWFLTLRPSLLASLIDCHSVKVFNSCYFFTGKSCPEPSQRGQTAVFDLKGQGGQPQTRLRYNTLTQLPALGPPVIQSEPAEQRAVSSPAI